MNANTLNRMAKRIFPKKLYGGVRALYFGTMLWINGLRYGGERYFCPCCGRHLSQFVDFNYKGNRYNKTMYETTYRQVICPCCQSLPRQRMVMQYLKDHIDRVRGSRILIFAPSNSEAMWFKRNHIAYTSADLFEYADLKLDIQSMELEDESYDIVLCNHVLEHVLYYDRALKELYRIIRKNGFLQIAVPQREDLMETPATLHGDACEENKILYGQEDHLRIFGMDFESMLCGQGFVIEAVGTARMPKSIKAVTGPALYDYNRLYICHRETDGKDQGNKEVTVHEK